MQAHLPRERDERADIMVLLELEVPRPGLDLAPDDRGLHRVQARLAGGVQAIHPVGARDPGVLHGAAHDPDPAPVDLEAPSVEGHRCHGLWGSSRRDRSCPDGQTRGTVGRRPRSRVHRVPTRLGLTRTGSGRFFDSAWGKVTSIGRHLKTAIPRAPASCPRRPCTLSVPERTGPPHTDDPHRTDENDDQRPSKDSRGFRPAFRFDRHARLQRAARPDRPAHRGVARRAVNRARIDQGRAGPRGAVGPTRTGPAITTAPPPRPSTRPPRRSSTPRRPAVVEDMAIADRLRSYAAHARGDAPDPDGEPVVEPLVILTLEDALRISEQTGP
jgi:hypothetical protein